MKECTFQPNLGLKKINQKEAQENINSLYIEGVHKLRSKKGKEIKELEVLSMECTFRPKINELYRLFINILIERTISSMSTLFYMTKE